MVDFPLMLQVKLFVADRVYPQSKKFATGVQVTQNLMRVLHTNQNSSPLKSYNGKSDYEMSLERQVSVLLFLSSVAYNGICDHRYVAIDVVDIAQLNFSAVLS